MSAISEPEKDLYEPSHWSKRFSSSEEVLNYHLKFIENASENVRRNIQCHLNIPYGDSERQKFDIFGTDLSDESPVMVVIHGGYWQETSIRRDSYHFIAQHLHSNGIKSIFVGYDLCPKITLPEIAEQIGKVATKCIEYAKGSKGVYFAGHSAGAHLVATLFRETLSITDIVKGAILISGVFDLSPLLKTVINEPMGMDEKVAVEMSPLKQNLGKSEGTEFRLVVGENESPEFINQSKEFAEKLLESGFKACFSVVEKVDHFDIIERLYDEDFELTKCIVEMIKNKREQYLSLFYFVFIVNEGGGNAWCLHFSYLTMKTF